MGTKTTLSARQKSRKQEKTPGKSKPRVINDAAGQTYLAAAALVITVFACYGNSLGNGFVFDDTNLVFSHSRLQSASEFWQLITAYRPLRHLSYVVDYAIWGERAFGFHLTNVLIHAANSIMVFFIARRLLINRLAAVVAAMIFAAHPIQTDSVAYISGRRDVLFAFFYLAALLSYLRYRAERSPLYFALFLIGWALSLMSKEMAVSLPAVIFLWNFCNLWHEQTGSWAKRSLSSVGRAFGKDWLLYIALVAAGLSYGFYMVFVRGASGRASAGGIDYWGGSFLSNALTAIRVQAWYLKQMIFPTPIAQYYGAFDISYSVADWRVIVSFAAVAAALAAGLFALKRDKLIAFAILAYFAMLLPVSQIIPHHELVADHYLYLPVFSLALIAGRLVERESAAAKDRRQLAYGAVVVLLGFYAVTTFLRNRDWKDEFAVWKANYESVPESPRAAHNLGGFYATRDPARAEDLFKQALNRDAGFEPAYLSLARLYVTQKRLAEAEEMVAKGIAVTDSNQGSRIIREKNLFKSQLTSVQAAARWEASDPAATERLLLQSITLAPHNVEAHKSLANLYSGKDPAKEIEALKRGVASNSNSFELRARLAAMLIETKQYQDALAHLRHMLSLAPTSNDCKRAEQYLNQSAAGVSRSMELRE
ncbi:MAG TPA: tetratricopeptide repeat protein, partial [Blastocatellia bacterium]|nr:tetratricopeptide repeat protein [Blastocatellia bacterium]